MSKKRTIIYILGVLMVVLAVLGILHFLHFLRVQDAKIEVVLVEDLTANFTDVKHVSDYIVSMNGTNLDDYVIDTNSVGEKEVKARYLNDENIEVQYTFSINVVDTVSPVIWLSGSYTITKGSDVDIAKKVLCGDNEDASPECVIEGKYNKDKVGVYPLVFKATDRSGNETTQKFNLNVIEPKKNTNKTPTEPTYTYFSDIKNKFKTEDTRIGIDVSSWQGKIDFDALKNAGVEFVIIRVGGTRGRDGEYFVDNNFNYNIEQANRVGIDVGIYFYSYANSLQKAREEALWVIDKIKDYNVTLPIAYDWENWSSFNEYNLSFFGLTSMADEFLDTVSEHGYKGLRYSSKSYLEQLWLPSDYETWLAHYVDKTNYQGEYTYWQLCDDGKVDGIKGPVDIDIMYK